MFYLKASAALVGIWVLANLIAFIIQIIFMIPFGAPVATFGFFALAIWGLYKLAMNIVEGK